MVETVLLGQATPTTDGSSSVSAAAAPKRQPPPDDSQTDSAARRFISVTNPVVQVQKLNPPTRLLCGPGPGNAHPRVHAAMSLPLAGHMDPDFLSVCEDVKTLLRYAWQTQNEFTIPISGAAMAAWEAVVANLTIPGEVHLVLVNGFFGERHVDMGARYGADVRTLRNDWGKPFTLSEIRAAVELHKPKLLWICHAETSTGAIQSLEGVGDICHANGCLVLADTVTSLGATPFSIDALAIDAAYTGSQKCLSCPPGISAVSLGNRALAKILEREAAGVKVPNWYLDFALLKKYYFPDPSTGKRVYHHTVPVSMLYALREALTLLAEEGLENLWARHLDTTQYFWSLCDEVGLEMFVGNRSDRLLSLQTVKVPQGINASEACKYCRENFRIEIGEGLGRLSGEVFRVGLMGYNSRREVALSVVSALSKALQDQGWTPRCSVCN